LFAHELCFIVDSGAACSDIRSVTSSARSQNEAPEKTSSVSGTRAAPTQRFEVRCPTPHQIGGPMPDGIALSRIGASICFGVAGAIALGGCGEPAGAQGGPPQAPPVSVAPAVQRPVAESEEFSGRIEATEYVELRPPARSTRCVSPTAAW
jgi:hypothetical protein